MFSFFLSSFFLKKSFILKSPLSQQGPASCESCTQLQRQLTELQRQLLLTKAEKDEALKLKEEVKESTTDWVTLSNVESKKFQLTMIILTGLIISYWNIEWRQTDLIWLTANSIMSIIESCHGGGLLNPLSPNIHIQILQTDLYTFPYRMSKKNLIKDQSVSLWWSFYLFS